MAPPICARAVDDPVVSEFGVSAGESRMSVSRRRLRRAPLSSAAADQDTCPARGSATAAAAEEESNEEEDEVEEEVAEVR